MKDKPLLWLHGEVKSPPLSQETRLQMGYFLRLLQKGQTLEMPHSRPMPSIGIRCHELRVSDNKTRKIWRLVYRIDSDAVVILDVFQKLSPCIINQIFKIIILQNTTLEIFSSYYEIRHDCWTT